MANYKLPPRQKMINLLYIILIAMLAINISSDVLDGFHTASRDMEANVKALKGYNGALMKLAAQKGNGSLAEELYAEATRLTGLTEELRAELKAETAKNSLTEKGMDADDNLNAVETVMLGENAKNAGRLKAAMESLKATCLKMNGNDDAKAMVESLLNTEATGKSWEEDHFANLPVIGAEMMLNKVEKDAWLAVNETLKELGAVQTDSLKKVETAPETNIDNQLLRALVAQLERQNTRKEAAGNVVKANDGSIKAVVLTENKAPLFANFENVLNITVASADKGAVKVELSGGKVKKAGKHYVAIPDGKTAEAMLTVSQNGKVLTRQNYRVMQLPAPTPYLTYRTENGKLREYRSNVPLNRKELATLTEVLLDMEAGVDTGEQVNGFDMVVIKNGNKTVITEHANSGKLTDNMKRVIAGVVKGDKLFFTNITVKGKMTPERQVASINVIAM